MTTTASLASADVASPDILRQIFGWIATEENLLSISKVCRNWRSALDHDSVWAELCQGRGWPRKGRDWFIRKFQKTVMYREGILSHTVLTPDKQFGVNLLHSPEPLEYFDWKTGVFTKANHRLLVVGASAPKYDFRVIDMGTRKCVRDFVLVKGEETKQEIEAEEKGEEEGQEEGQGQVVDNAQQVQQVGAAMQGGGQVEEAAAEWRLACACMNGDHLFFADAMAPTLHLLDFRTHRRPSGEVATRGVEFERRHTSTITIVQMVGEPSSTQDNEIPFLGASGEPSSTQDKEIPFLGASGSYDGSVRIWDLATGRQLSMFDGEKKVWTLAFHPQGTAIAIGGETNLLQIAQTDNGTPLASLSGHDHTVMTCEFDPFDPDNVVFSGSYDKTIIQWDWKKGAKLRVFEGHENVVFSLHALEMVVVSGSRDGTVKVWDKHSGVLLRSLPQHEPIKVTTMLSETGVAAAVNPGLNSGAVHVFNFGEEATLPSTLTASGESENQSGCVLM